MKSQLSQNPSDFKELQTLIKTPTPTDPESHLQDVLSTVGTLICDPYVSYIKSLEFLEKDFF